MDETLLTPLDLAELLEMPLDDLCRVLRFRDAPDVKRSVLTGEGSNSAHVVTVVRVLVATEDVHSGVGKDVLFWG